MSSASSASPSIPDDKKDEEKENIEEIEDFTVDKVDGEKIKQLEKEMETLQVNYFTRALDTVFRLIQTYPDLIQSYY